MPTMGLLESPREFGMGVLRGTSSLLRKLIASLCATGGQLAATLQGGLVALGVVDCTPAHAVWRYRVRSPPAAPGGA